ncbi:flavodoxin [Lysobacter sp. TY2-98]|uniref:flavodoxin family protein n=1 Tax=Lysobacter sp. TY2-98 TaxID=2290922 RepID=UPI0013B4436A|nr:flavodoxin [Lysobacter sp. TY2-98]
MARSLVVYYSRTGNTRRLAHEIRDMTGADIEELAEATRSGRPPGWVRCGVEAALRLRPSLQAATRRPSEYDLVFVGAPIWMGRFAPVARAYVATVGRGAPRLAFFCTQRGATESAAVEDLERLAGARAVAAYSERVGAVPDVVRHAEVQRFVRRAQRGHVSTFDRGAGQPSHAPTPHAG